MANDDIDPHILVLLMNYKYEQRQDGAPRRVDTRSYVLDHGLENDHETNHQTFRVLDALASLSICKSKTQVLALAMQPDPAKREITLTLAENKTVNTKVEAYLKKLWEGLQELSNFYASSLPEELDDKVSFHFKAKIYRAVFEHTLPKQLVRVQVHLTPLIEFTKEVLKYSEDLEKLEDLYCLVCGLQAILYFMKELYDGKKMTDEEWNNILLTVMVVSDQATIVLMEGDHFGCETLAIDHLNKLTGMSILPPFH